MKATIWRSLTLAGLVTVLSLSATLPVYADPGNNGNNSNNQGRNNGSNPSTRNSAPNSAGSTGNGGSTTRGSNGGTAQAGNPPGANGTVKIHDYPEHKNGAEMANDPKVCQFELHGFKFDAAQSGRFWIQDHKWGNGDATQAVLAGNYGPADAQGDWTNGPYRLADGHYKLFVEMTHTAGNSGNTSTTYKHKVFKVECAVAPSTSPSASPSASPSVAPSASPSTSPSASPSATPAPTLAGSTGTPTPTATPTPIVESTPTPTPTPVTNGGSGSVVAGIEQGPANGNLLINPIVTIPGTIGATIGNAQAGSEQTPVTAQAGLEQTPVTAQAGLEQTPAQTQAGLEQGAVQGVSQLPSTSTSTPHNNDLAVLFGVLASAMGAALWRVRQLR